MEALAERYPAYRVEPTPQGEQFPLADYWRLILKRKWTIVAAFVVVTVLGTIYTLRQQRIYEAVARLNIMPRENAELLPNQNNTNVLSQEDMDALALETQVNVLKANALALQVIRTMHLGNNGQPAAPGKPAANLDVSREDALLNSFHANLKVANVPNTRLIELRYTSPDPRLAADVVNTLARAYIEQNVRSRYESTMEGVEWLQNQLADLQIKVEQSQEKLVKYQKEHDILGLDEKQNITTQKLDELNKELTQAEADRIQKESIFTLARKSGVDKVPGGQGDLAQKLHDQLVDLHTQEAQMTLQFGPNWPKVIELKTRISEIEKQIRAENDGNLRKVEMAYAAALQRESMLRAALNRQKQDANTLNESAIEFNLLKRDAESNRQLYENMLAKLKESALAAGLRSTNIRLVDPARVPSAPAQPNIPRNLAMSLVLGLACGIGLAFILEAVDTTVRTPSDAEVTAALPALGVIPIDAARNARNLLIAAPKAIAKTATAGAKPGPAVSVRPRSDVAEAYRSLRTSILLSSPAGPPRVLLVTSALPQEGKTTTSANVALTLAQHGKRVLLVDADLRRPGLDKAFGFRATEGLSTVLNGGTPYESVLRQAPHQPNLTLLPAGPTTQHPAELLGSSTMVNLVARWRQDYDHVVIDTPPVLSVTDPVLLSVIVDSVVLVVRSGSTNRPALKRASDLLNQVRAPLLGVVVNAMDFESADYYYYYSYYSGSKYRYVQEDRRVDA